MKRLDETRLAADGTRRANAALMTSFRARPIGLVSVTLVLVATRVAQADVDDDQFQKEVIVCEEALARLTTCCPRFEPQRVLCNYRRADNEGCGYRSIENVSPALSDGESRCIRSLSCGELQAKKVCERAQEAETYQTRLVFDGGTALDGGARTHAPVCP